MSFEKLLRANVGVYAYYPEAFADPAAPTAAELNDLFVYGSNEDALGFNVSCALLDDFTLNMTDSDTDDSISICDIGNVSTPTFQNYEAELNFFRDRSVTANGVYNLAFDQFKGADRPYILVKRIGFAESALFTTTQIISMYSVSTDYPTDVIDDNSMLQFGARFKPTGDVNINYEIAA